MGPLLAVLCLLLIAWGTLSTGLAVAPATANDELSELRALRRAAIRAAVQAKDAGEAAPFGLLVIPVDFADVRFAADFNPWTDLWPRLADDAPGSLAHYFHVASRGRTRLEIRLAPRVSLPGERLDYSDIYWQGNARGRLLASQALHEAADLGVDFAAADLDHDGEVDGVLLLHAAPGLENDPDGLLPPNQFFLDEPVVQRGTIARAYALVAARSGLGLWAHETGHLLGLEDRYDLGLPGSGETGPRGGLGRYSLMSAGWLGSGQADDPSLPDAYSCLQLGWVDLGDRPGPATVVRLLVQGAAGPEFFLAAQAYPALTAPYDAVIPAERLILLHIDETLAEGQASAPDWPARHLRVNLVPADGDDAVARGLSQGRDLDLLPAVGTWQEFNDETIPSSRTWAGAPSGVDIRVDVTGGQLEFTSRGEARRGDLRLSFAVDRATIQPRLQLRYPAGVPVPASVAVTVTALDTTWGRFAAGESLAATLVQQPDGQQWAQLADDGLAAWQPAAVVPAGARTDFAYTIAGGQDGAGDLVWVWGDAVADLALDGPWPGDWTEEFPTGVATTRWHRWLDGPSDQGVMLACTGAEHTGGAGWPDVLYSNSAHAVLLSPWLAAGVQWVELTHTVDLELLHPGVAIDGVVLRWHHAGGLVVPATPADGWLGVIDSRPWHALAGQPTFAEAATLRGPHQRPLWRRDVLPLPDPARHGPGPWRLQFELASNTLWRERGWLVRDLVARPTPPPASGFALAIVDDHLWWDRDAIPGAWSYTVETSRDGGATWQESWYGTAPTAGMEQAPPTWPAITALAPVPGRTLARVLAHTSGDAVVSRALPLLAPREPRLGRPWPNPGRSYVQFAVDGAGDPQTVLELFDLRGRLVRRWHPGPDATVIGFSGDDAAGRRVAAGVYLVRMLAHGRILTSKVTWLPGTSASF
jgi:M6 family metalloprotease-like protein